MAVHVFWDNSNIWIGLQKFCEKKEAVPSSALRVYIKNLDDYIIRGRREGVKIIAGSYPPECEQLLETARSLGYDTHFMQRVLDGKNIREQGVDTNLHLQMSLALNRGNKGEVMAVLTGDSNIDPDSGIGFVEIIELALSKGWSVEVYAVKDTISKRKYTNLEERFGSDLQIEYLESIYDSITYLVEGDYYYHDNPSSMIHVSERVVSPKTW